MDEEPEECVCPVCHKILSRKQRLQSHLETIHGIKRDAPVKKYKRYEMDNTLPIPLRTKYRKMSKTTSDNLQFKTLYGNDIESQLTQDDSIERDFSHDYQEDPSDSIENTSIACSYEAESFDNTDGVPPSHDMMMNGQHTLISRQESDIESDTDSSLTSMTSFDSDFESDEEDVTTCTKESDLVSLTDDDEKCMALLSYIIRHHLSGNASNDLLKLIKLFTDTNDRFFEEMSLNKLKEIVGNTDIELIHFCDKCFAIFPSSEFDDIFKCTTEGCNGLKYKGSEQNQKLKRNKSFFACLSVVHQIRDILQRDGVWQAICTYKNKCRQSRDICDITTAEIYRDLQKPGKFLGDIESTNISFVFNTDGIPLYHSSGISLWPVYLSINELPPTMRFSRKNMILWGVWQGKGKPIFHTFFQPFIRQMINLKEEGILWTNGSQQICTKAILLAGTLDLQAKAYLTSMTMFNGKFGCISCEEEGEVIRQGKGHTRIYPYREEQPSMRTTEGILADGLKAIEEGKTEKGIKGVSPLLGMEWFDIVYGTVPDYMHGLLLGVTKKILNLLLSSANADLPSFIGKHVKSIDKILKKFKPTDQVSRLPRKLEKNLHQYKASELEIFLLFYSIPTFINFMSEDVLSHFGLLVEGSYILLSDRISMENLARAKTVLMEFYANYEHFYGRSNCTLNLHNTCVHLVSYVEKLGPLWAWSCFPYEDMNGSIIESVHGTGDVCLQILWLIQAQKRLLVDCNKICSPVIQRYVQSLMLNGRRNVTIKHVALNCSIAGGMKDLSENLLPEEKVRQVLKIDEPQLGKMSKILRVVCNEVTYYSEEYTRMKKRIAFAVLIEHENETKMCSVQYFVYHHNSDRCFAVVKPLVIDNNMPLVNKNVKHLVCVKKIEDVDIVLVENIKEKLMFLNGNKKLMCIARLPHLYNICT